MSTLFSRQIYHELLAINDQGFAKIYKTIMALGNGNLPLLVRFPQGVSPAPVKSLLQSYDQDELIIVSPESNSD